MPTSTRDGAAGIWQSAGNLIAQRPLAAAVVVQAVATVAVLTIFGQGFRHDDDILFAMLLSGELVGEPVDDVVFMNRLVTALLGGLYDWTSVVPWYAVYVYVPLAVASVLLLWVAFSRLNPGRPAQLAVVLATGPAVLTSYWVSADWTSSAMLLAVAGLLLVAMLPSTQGSTWAVGITGGVCLGVASLMRFDALLGMVPVLIPAGVMAVRRVPVSRLVWCAVPAVVVVSTGVLVDSGRSAEWEDYLEWTAAQGGVRDSPVGDLVDANDPVLVELDWSFNDFEMFERWFATDPVRYSTANLTLLGDRSAGPLEEVGTRLDRVRIQVANLARAHFPLGFATLGFLVLAIGIPRRQQWLVISTAAATALVGVYLLWFRKLSERIGVPYLTVVALVGLLAWLASDMPSPRSRSQRVGVGLVIAAGVMGVVAYGVLSQCLDDRQAVLAAQLTDLEQFDPDGVFVVWEGLALKHASPFDADELTEVDVVFTGWLATSPPWNEQLVALGIDDVYAAIVERPDVHLVVTDPDYIASYVEYMREHYGEELVVVAPAPNQPAFIVSFETAP